MAENPRRRKILDQRQHQDGCAERPGEKRLASMKRNRRSSEREEKIPARLRKMQLLRRTMGQNVNCKRLLWRRFSLGPYTK